MTLYSVQSVPSASVPSVSVPGIENCLIFNAPSARRRGQGPLHYGAISEEVLSPYHIIAVV